MSLAIHPEKITDVLLADGWYDIAPESFIVDAYEYLYQESNGFTEVLYGGGGGFNFDLRDGTSVYGPMSAILAVKVDG